MILPELDKADILYVIKRDAERHAQVWLDIVRYLENKIDEEYNERYDTHNLASYPDVNGTRFDDDGVQFTYTSKDGQGNDLSRDGERKQSVRYHRGSEASTEWSR